MVARYDIISNIYYSLLSEVVETAYKKNVTEDPRLSTELGIHMLTFTTGIIDVKSI